MEKLRVTARKAIYAGDVNYILEIGGNMLAELDERQAEQLVDAMAALGIVTADPVYAPPTPPAKPDPSIAYLEAALQIQGQHIQDLRDQVNDSRAFLQVIVNRGLKPAPLKRNDHV